VHHRTIQINHQPDATIFQFFYPDVYLQLNMFRAFSRPLSGARWLQRQPWLYLRIVVTVLLCSWWGRPARPRIQHDCHHDTKVKAEAVTAVIKLLIMGGKTSETCWAVNKREDKKLKNCCIWLVIYLNWSGLINFGMLLTSPLGFLRFAQVRCCACVAYKMTSVSPRAGWIELRVVLGKVGSGQN